MSYTSMLLDGPNSLVQNTVYATPGKAKYILSDAVLSVCTTAGGSFAAVAASTTGMILPGGLFVKSTGANAICVLSDQ